MRWIVRLRGTDRVGLSFIEVLRRLAEVLRKADSALELVIGDDRVTVQIRAHGLIDELGAHNVYCARRGSARP